MFKLLKDQRMPSFFRKKNLYWEYDSQATKVGKGQSFMSEVKWDHCDSAL